MKREWLTAGVVLLVAGGLIAQTRDIMVGSGPGGGAPPRAAYEDSWALIIAINNYQYVPKLKYAVADGEAIRNYLTATGGFHPDHVLTLYDERANKANIETALGTYLPGKVNVNDRVLVFFAGHGKDMALPDGGKMGYLIPVEGNPNNLYGTCLSMSAIRETSRMLRSKHVLFLVDACYSGIAGVLSRSIPETTSPAYLQKLTSQRAIEIMTAGQANETVLEGPQFGGGHSIFTATLLTGLQQGNADMNGDGIIPANELYTYMSAKVTQDSGGHQTPKLYQMDGDGICFFHHAHRPSSRRPRQ